MNIHGTNLIPSTGNLSQHATANKQHGSNTVFEHIFYDSPVPMCSCDQDGFITFFNAAAVELWGRTPKIAEDQYCGAMKIYYPDGLPMPLSEWPMAKALKQARAFSDETIVIETADHIFKTLKVFAHPILDDNHHPVGAHNTLIDITEKEQTDNKQAILSAIVESSDSAIISKDLTGIITSWNPGAQKVFGYSEDDIVGKSILHLIPSHRIHEESVILTNLKAGRRIDHMQTTRMTKDGREIHVSLTVSPVKDQSGRIIGASKIARDITEEIRAQQAIKQNTRNLEILNSIGKVIVEKLDVNIILQKVTDATTNITGADFGAFYYNSIDEDGEDFELLALSGALKESFPDLKVPGNASLFEKTFNSKMVIRSGDITKDPRIVHDDPHFTVPPGQPSLTSYLAVPVLAKDGKVIGGLIFGHQRPEMFTSDHEDLVGSIASQAAVALDNSTLFEEVKALSAKKDEFIALASHELKTPLTSIKGYLQISARTEKDKVGQMFISKALTQVERLNALVTDLLDSSKVVAGKLQFNTGKFDLCESLREVIETFHYANNTHQIIFDDPQCKYVIEGDRQRIEQVVSNLLNNAIKYSPDADKVYVSTDLNAGYVTVKIRDEGIGISFSQKTKIFARFYRAEGPANISGLGLGLYLTKEIIDRHEGTIDVNTELEKGTEFFFSLPLNT